MNFKIIKYKAKEIDLIEEIGVEAHHELKEKLTKYINNFQITNTNLDNGIKMTKMEIIIHCKVKGIEATIEVTAPFVVNK